jgi:hypothetical protein
MNVKAAISALFAGTRPGNAFDALFNRYEAAQPSSPRRSYLPAFVRDARYDANAFTRWELVRKIRYFACNTWLVQKLREEFIKYTIGANGLPVIPNSSDPEWNSRMEESYMRWCETPSLDSDQPMVMQQKLMAGEFFIDGEAWVLKTRGKSRKDAPSFPRIQLIESHRVSSPGTPFGGIVGSRNGSADSPTQVDGIEIDANGRKTGIWIRDGFNAEQWLFRPADQVIQIFEPSRAGQYRGLTPFHACLNALHDLDDLEMFEMDKAKEAAVVANVLETWNGEIPKPSNLVQARLLGGLVNPAPSGSPIDEELMKRLSLLQEVIGARSIAIKPGEKITQFRNDCPSAATQWYWRYKVSQICSAVGVPMVLVLPESIQGTVTRAVLDDANIHFRSKFALFAHSTKEIYRYYAQWARYNDPELVDAPYDWMKCKVVPPRSVNVDVGRNSAAMLAEYAAGTKSLDGIAGAEGETPETLITSKGRNVAMVKRIAKEISIETGEEVSPEEIMGSLAEVQQIMASVKNSPGNDAVPQLEAEAA